MFHAANRAVALCLGAVLLLGTLGAGPALASEPTPVVVDSATQPEPVDAAAEPTPEAPAAAAEAPQATTVTYSGIVTRLSSALHGDTVAAESPSQLFRVPGLGFLTLDFSATPQALASTESIRVRVAVPAGTDLGTTERSAFDALTAAGLAGTTLAVTEVLAQPMTKALVTNAPPTAAVHRVYALLVTPKNVAQTAPGPGQTASEATAAIAHSDAYWNEQSSGKVDLSLQGVAPWYRSAYGCRTVAESMNIWSEAAAVAKARLGYSEGANTHLVLFFPANADCGGSIGLGTVGYTINSGGMLWSIGTSSAIGKSTLSHELGHNLSLGHANYLDCASSDPRLSSPYFTECAARNYGDIHDVMGYGMQGKTGGAVSSPHAIRSALWGGDAWTQAPDGTSSYTLSPVSGNAGLRSVVVTDDYGHDYFIEYRDFSGEDAQYSTMGCAPTHGWCVVKTPSVRVLRLWSAGSPGDDAYLVGRTVSGVKSVGYTAGQRFASAGISVTVTGIAGGAATVTVRKSVEAAGEVALAASSTGLVATTSGWASGTAFTYAWYRDGRVIPGATGRTYSPVAADGNNALLHVAVTGRHSDFAPRSVLSPQRNVTLAGVGTLDLTASGPVRLGGVLAATTLTYAVDKGVAVASPSRTHQWLRNGAVIPGATMGTYRLVAADVGARIAVRVTAVQPGFAPHVAVSPATPAVGAGVIAGTLASAVVQRNAAGTVLTARPTPGAVTETGVAYAYQWYRNGTIIKNAKKSAYVVVAADRGKALHARIVVSKAGYTSGVLYSTPLRYTVVPTAPLTVAGAVRVGSTLSIAPVAFTGAGAPITPSRSYQWYRNGSKIPKATRATYLLTAADRGKRITVRTVASSRGLIAHSVVLRAPGTVALGVIPGNPTPPTVTLDQARRVLTVAMPASSITFTGKTVEKYQWMRDGAAIAGATGTTYALTAADVGRAIHLRVVVSKPSFATVVLATTPTSHWVVPSTAEPRIVGDIAVGTTITTAPRTYSHGAAPAYQWLRNGTPIAANATAPAYTLVDADRGAAISVRVTAAVVGTIPSVSTSAPTQAVGDFAMNGGDAPAPVLVTKTPGSLTFTANPVTSVAEEGTARSYQWYRGSAAIPNATGLSYTATAADSGATLSIRITHRKAGFTPVVATSAGQSASLSISGRASISPTLPRRGVVARFTAPKITAPDGAPVRVVYQWFRNGKRIVGATGLAYKPVAADRGKRLTARVVATSPGWLTAVIVTTPTRPLR